jgi:uncharacterized membrane protein YoaK (UPF0700 family)
VKNLPAEHEADMTLSIMLAFVGGYTDAFSYMTARVFAGPLTGNSVLATISAISRDWRQAAICAAAIFFMLLGVAGSTLLDARVVRNIRVPPLMIILLVEALLFLIPGWRELAGHPLPILATTALLCMALGLQTGGLRRTNGITVYTAFVAGMITQLVEGATERLRHREDAPPGSKLLTLARLLTAFVSGAAAGAAMTLYERRVTVAAAGLLLLVLAAAHLFRVHRMTEPV